MNRSKPVKNRARTRPVAELKKAKPDRRRATKASTQASAKPVKKTRAEVAPKRSVRPKARNEVVKRKIAVRAKADRLESTNETPWRRELVSEAALKAALDRVEELSPLDPAQGIFGSGSKVWEINREAVIFLGGGRAALLQLAHPFVGQAVAEHSRTRQDPLGRFIRTFENVFAMVYGDRPSAYRAARRVHGIHRRIVGRLPNPLAALPGDGAYAANEPEALLWVHATLWDTSIQIYELVIRPLSDAEKAAYYEETKRFALLFGIPEDLLPATWADFRGYFERMIHSDSLQVLPAAAEIARFLLRPPGTWLGPVFDWMAVLTSGLLPDRIRNQFDLRFNWADRLVFHNTLRIARTATWAIPPGRARYLPAYMAALDRLPRE